MPAPRSRCAPAPDAEGEAKESRSPAGARTFSSALASSDRKEKGAGLKTRAPNQRAPESAAAIVPVLLPLPLGGAYDYRAPEGQALAPGDFVEVPLGARRMIGVVWDSRLGGAPAPAAKLKSALRRLDAPPMRPGLRRLVEWVANYTLAPPGAVLRMAMSVPAALEPPRPTVAYRLSGADPEASGARLTAARRRVLAALSDGRALSGPELARAAGVGTAVIHGMAATGLVEAASLPPPAPFDPPDWRRAGPELSPAQAAAADDLTAKVAARAFAAVLLDGVTGAGKTEVYFEAIAAALAEGRQALVLLPEIALTAQWLDRFRARFGASPAEWHSDLTAAQRRRTWRAVATGEAQVVVGARSALFLPFPELGLIVVDEEHDGAFKQEEGVTYSARDMAVVRAHVEGFPILLVSATPSLETLVNVEAGRYSALHLPDRHAGATLPEIQLVDLRREPPPRGRWISPVLQGAITAALAAGEQAMLFLNRRGYAPLTLCRACGHRLHCPNCTAWLVEHRFHRILQCHHCGFTIPPPPTCPKCGAEDSLVPCGPGVERIAEDVAALFPEARCAVMASDTVTGPQAAGEFVRRVNAHEIDVLIGTQIVAKGHHFPLLTVVGVIDADLGLAGGDLRAGERTFQLLSQVAGRAGRAERPGRVFLQTWQPDNPVMQALARGDRERFLEAEKASRRDAGMPPFGRLAALILSGPEPAAVEAAARALARAAPFDEEVRVLGPAPAPLALLRGQYRWRLLLKASRRTNLQEVLRTWLAGVTLDKGVRLQVDVDPYSFL